MRLNLRPAGGWRAFAGEVGVIVLGVVIALAAQEAVEALNERREAAETRETLTGEIRESLAVLELRRAAQPCIDHRLRELRAIVNDWGRTGSFKTPRWVSQPTQPLGIEDLVQYLVAALDVKADESEVVEIGGPDRVSYADLMGEYARQRGLRRLMLRVPVLSPGLSSLWLGLVTPLYARVGRELIESTRNATVVADGRTLEYEGDGFFLGVSLVDHVQPHMAVYRDEIFGPVLSVVRVPTYDEGIGLINDNPYGNGVAIFTRDGGAARQFQFDVNAGMVGVNVPIPVPVAYYSFGGWKASLFGDTHMYGPDGIHFYTRQKVVTSRWPDPATSTVDLGFPRTR